MVLDTMLPGLDRIAVCRTLRALSRRHGEDETQLRIADLTIDSQRRRAVSASSAPIS
ncbi:MAG: hypothetical protein ACREMA_03485 [Longimicrobiales bacterium]